MKRKLPVEMNGEEKKSRVNVMMNGDSHDIQESGKQSWPAKRQCANGVVLLKPPLPLKRQHANGMVLLQSPPPS